MPPSMPRSTALALVFGSFVACRSAPREGSVVSAASEAGERDTGETIRPHSLKRLAARENRRPRTKVRDCGRVYQVRAPSFQWKPESRSRIHLITAAYNEVWAFNKCLHGRPES